MSSVSNIKKTPLYGFHLTHGAKMVSFAGWEMPVQYSGIIEEHNAVRSSVGLFDVSHMGEALVQGPEALEYLQHLMTNDISKLEPGKALYSLMCYENGGVVDDLLVYCMAPDRYLLCLNAGNTDKDVEWLKSHESNFRCTVKNVSDEYGQLALQGPDSCRVLSQWVEGIDSIERFSFRETEIACTKVILSRTGYTGEDGFEIYCAWEDTEKLAQALVKVEGVKLAGLGARDSLRLEAGYSLYGHEISAEISPLEAGLGFAVKLKKQSDFIGKEALQKQKDIGFSRKILFFKLEGRRIARQGAGVFHGDRQVGEVVSGTFSPTINQPIGSLISNQYEELCVDIRGVKIPLLLIKPPFI